MLTTDRNVFGTERIIVIKLGGSVLVDKRSYRQAAQFPKRQFLIKTPELAKMVNLTVDPKSYWLYTNDPFDNKKRREAFETHGFRKGLEILAGAQP